MHTFELTFYNNYEQFRHRQQPSTCQTFQYGVEGTQEQVSSIGWGNYTSIFENLGSDFKNRYLKRIRTGTLLGLGCLRSLGLLFDLGLGLFVS